MKYCPNCGYKLTEDTSVVIDTPLRASGEVVDTKDSVPSDYLTGNTGIAVPKVSEYREKFKSHKLTGADVRASTPKVPIIDNGEMNKFGDLVFGEGVVQEF